MERGSATRSDGSDGAAERYIVRLAYGNFSTGAHFPSFALCFPVLMKMEEPSTIFTTGLYSTLQKNMNTVPYSYVHEYPYLGGCTPSFLLVPKEGLTTERPETGPLLPDRGPSTLGLPGHPH